jgi:2-haloacid dehalogenase
MINTIIFDLGGVLIDWNPRYLYSKMFADEAAMDHFLNHICTSDWNEEQDAGRSLTEATRILIDAHPDKKENIAAFYDRWDEMLGGPIEGNVELFKQLKQNGALKIYALTNWSAETFPVALKRFDFLHWFDGIVVSGTEKMRKPTAAFYELLLNRYGVQAQNTLFIDDNLRNIQAAAALGLQVVHFITPEQLKQDLQQWGLLPQDA